MSTRLDNGDPNQPSQKRLTLGILFWILFSAVAVALRGVRWDETYEWAQVLVGDVRYPEDHPLNRFVWSAYTIQHFVTAAMLWLGDSSLVISGIRNEIVLVFGVSAIFLWTSHLSRSVMWGYAASALALFDVLTPFETTYPLRIWPHCFSDGPIGLGWALVTLYLIVALRWRLGLFMLAVMPTIHIGQMPAVFVTAMLFIAVQWREGNGREILRAWPYVAAGIAVNVALAVVIAIRKLPEPISGPYFSAADAWVIWSNYKEIWYHTSIRGGMQDFLQSHIALAAALVLSIGAAWPCVRRRAYGEPWIWLAVFCAATACAVWTAMILHTLLGPDVPFLVIGWMPYRLANHAPFLLLAMSIGLLAVEKTPAVFLVGCGIVCAGLVAFILSGALRMVIGNTYFDRYFADGAWIVLLLFGAAAVSLWTELSPYRKFRNAWAVTTGAAAIALVSVHQFGAIVIACGAMAAFSAQQVVTALQNGWRMAARVLRTTTVIALIALCARAWITRNEAPEKGFDVHHAVSDFDLAVRAYFSANEEENVMVVADNFAPFLQARIGQPVMANWMTDSYIIYTPEFGPPIQKIYKDIYGISFGESLDGRRPQQPEVWQAAWAFRPLGGWQTLGEAYNFRYVIAPEFVKLGLEPVVEQGGQTLYRIQASQFSAGSQDQP